MRRMDMAAVLVGAALVLGPSPSVVAQLPGVTDTEIRIGNTMAYTGPGAAFGDIGRTLSAFFEMINAEGGINGRRINFISYDDGYSPPRTLEQARRLVESDDVLLVFQSLGNAGNLAIREYLNAAGVPQLFMAAGGSMFDDPANYPWTMRWNPSTRAEGQVYGRYIVENYPNARVGILYQNDALGTDYLAGLTDVIGPTRAVLTLPYDTTDGTIEPQILALQSAGVEVFVDLATSRFATQAILRAAEVGWRPHHILTNAAASVSGVLEPAGLANAIGIVSAIYPKDPGYAGWQDGPDIVAFQAFMAAYHPRGNPRGIFEAYAYSAGSVLVEVLRLAGEDLTRENVMRIATNLVDLDIPNLLPGIRVNTSPTDYAPIEQFGLVRFDGAGFVPFGDLIDVTDR